MIIGIYAEQLVDELLLLLSDRVGWPHSLFLQSTVGLIEELLVAGDQCANGVLTGASFDNLSGELRNQLLADPGFGVIQQRGPLTRALPSRSTDFLPSSFRYKATASSVQGWRETYLANWRNALQQSLYEDAAAPAFQGGLAPHLVAELLAAHLLQLGVSNTFLVRWLSYRARHDLTQYTLGDLLDEMEALSQTGRGPARVLVALAQPPPGDIRSTGGWLDAKGARQWLADNNHRGPRTLHGGILYESEQWDLDGALASVAAALAGLRNRAMMKTGKTPDFHPDAWVAGVAGPRRIPALGRLGLPHTPDYEVGSPTVEAPASNDRLEVSIELLIAGMSEPGPSAAGTLWAALEALLAAPGDADRIQVVDRAGDIALVSFLRSSLHIALGRLFSRCKNDALTTALTGLDRPTRLLALEAALRRDDHLSITDTSTRVMMIHAKQFLVAAALTNQRSRLRQALRGLYRHRNLVLHGGITDAPLREGVLRSSAPLVAAVVNRYAHSQQAGTTDAHVFAYEMQNRVDSYETDPRNVFSSVW